MSIVDFINKYKYLYWFLPFSGLFLAFSQPNVLSHGGFWGVEYIGAFLLLLTMFAPKHKTSVLLAFLSGMIYWGIGLYWVVIFGVTGYIVLIILFSLLFFALPAAVARIVENEKLRLILFALLFTGIEWLRSLSVYGFPAGELGGGNINIISKTIISIGGTNFYTLFIFAVAILIILRDKKYTAIAVNTGIILVLLALFPYVSAEFYKNFGPKEKNKIITVTLLQPATLKGITPASMEEDDKPEEIAARNKVITNLVRQSPEADLIIMPENIIYDQPVYPHDFPNYLAVEKDCYLLYGVIKEDPENDNIYNSAYLVNPEGEIIDEYYKRQLMPFGEFVPMRSFIQQYYPVRDVDMTRGTSDRPFKVEDIKIGVLICYDSLFSRLTMPSIEKGANLLVSITNDAWFGTTAAIFQHYGATIHRSIESGVPVIQVGNTGVTGIYDAYDFKNNLRELAVDEAGTSTLALVLTNRMTFFRLFGKFFGPGIFALGVLLSLWYIFFAAKIKDNYDRK